MREGRNRALAGGAAWLVALTGALAAAGYCQIFSQFSPYDDEGLLLISLRNFMAGHPLFDAVSTQYGPAYFLFHRLLFEAVSQTPTHDGIRLVSLGLWLTGSLGFAAAVLGVTRSQVAASLALVATFVATTGSMREPGHPGILLFALTGLAAALAARPDRGVSLPALGVLCAAACFVKLNVGAFLTLAVAWTLGVPRSEGAGRLLRAAGGVAIAALPTALMSQRLGDPQVALFAFVTTTAALVLLQLRPSIRTSDPAGWRDPLRLAVPFGVTATALGGYALVLGTSPGGLIHGLVTQHLGLAHQFFADPQLDWTSVPVALLALAAGSLAARRSGSLVHLWEGRGLSVAVAGFALVALCFATYRFPGREYSTYDLAWFLPWTWLVMFAAPPRVRRESGLGRFALLAIAVLAVLQTYPVAGSQLLLGAAPMIAIAAVLLHDATDSLVCSSRSHRGRFAARTVPLALAASLVGVASWSHARLAVVRYQRGQAPTALDGASRLRLPELQLATLEGVTLNVAAAHANALLTMPGMYSFNLWSGVDSPSLLNRGFWPFSFSHAEQRAVLTGLRAAHRARVVSNPRMIAFWNRSGAALDGPLLEHIRSHFVPALRVGDYQLLAPTEQIAEVRSIGARWRAPPAGHRTREGDVFARATIAFPRLAARIHRLAIVDPVRGISLAIATRRNGEAIVVRGRDGTTRSLTLEALARQGVGLDAVRELVVSVYGSASPTHVVRAFDAGGHVVARLPFVEVEKPERRLGAVLPAPGAR